MKRSRNNANRRSGGTMTMSSDVTADVAKVYVWVDSQLAGQFDLCKACGDCCDFEKYDHRLYVTAAEVLYFQEVMKSDLRGMHDGVCPYRVENRCSVHKHRFAGCRIFNCCGDSGLQGQISEGAIEKLKAISDKHGIEYSYVELSKALNSLAQ